MLPQNRRKGEVPSTKAAYKNYLDVAWPAAMQGLLIDLMMAIDLAMVGALGANALAAVGIMSQPKMILLVVARALSVPITALIARRKGEGNFKGMNATLKQGLVLTLLLYLPLILIFLKYLPEILTFAGAQNIVLNVASGYGLFITIGVFFTAVTQIIGAALIGIGHTNVVFKANVIGNIINTLLNFLLIYGIGFFPRLEVMGAGIATMLGNIVAMIIIIYAVLGSKKELTLSGKESWCFKIDTLKSIGKMGGSSLGEQSFERFGMFAYTKMVAQLGVVPLATHHVCMSLCDIFYSFSMGLGYASASHTGQNLGKKRDDLAEVYGKIGIRVGLILSFIACFLYIVFRNPLMHIYTQDSKVIALGLKIIIIMSIAAFPQTVQLVYSGVLKGAGDNFYVMLYSLIVIAIFRPILTYILCFVIDMGLYGAWIALLCDQSLRMVFATARFKKEKWKTIKL